MASLNLEKIASELSTLFVEVTLKDANDYKKLQHKLVLCNLNQDTVVRHMTIIEPLIAKKTNAISTKKFELNTRKIDIKTNVKDVKNRPTAKERDEAAEELLHADYEDLLKMENAHNDLMMVKNSLVTTLRKLKTTEQNIKLLKSMLDEQVNKLNVGSTDDPDVAHLQKQLSELDDLDEQLDSEIGLEEDVENSEEYTEEETIEETDDEDGATHDTTKEPSTEPLDSQASHDASDDLSDIVDDVVDSRSDASERPSTEPLDLEESRADEAKSEDSSNEDLDILTIDDEVDLTADDDTDNDIQDDEEVTAKQPAPNDDKGSSKTGKRKRTPMEEILGEDLPDDDPVDSSLETAVVEDDIDISSFMDDMDIDSDDEEDQQATGAEDTSEEEEQTEDSVSVDGLSSEDGSVQEVEEEVEEEPPVVEDEASIGEEYDIESLLDM